MSCRSATSDAKTSSFSVVAEMPTCLAPASTPSVTSCFVSPVAMVSLIVNGVRRTTKALPAFSMFAPLLANTASAACRACSKQKLSKYLLCGYPQAPLARPEGRLFGPRADSHPSSMLEWVSCLHHRSYLSELLNTDCRAWTRINIPRCLYIPNQRSSPPRGGLLRLVNKGSLKPPPLGGVIDGWNARISVDRWPGFQAPGGVPEHPFEAVRPQECGRHG